MNVLMDGLAVLVDQAWPVFSILITVVWGQIIFIALFKKTFKNQFTNAEYFSLGMAGWILPVALLSLLLFAAALLFGEIGVMIILLLAVVALMYAVVTWRLDKSLLPVGSAFIGILAVFLILQLAFLKKMLLPSYFDSAEHYRIIKYFAEYNASSGGSFPLTNYYHVGFHLFSATVSHVFHLGIVDTMLMFGQAILAIVPFSLFFIVKREVGSNAAAAFTCLLAGAGWHMPSHAMDWGKYPALFSLVGIHFVLSIGYLMYKNASYLKNVILSGSEGSLLRPSETLWSQRTLPQSDRSVRLALHWLLGFGILISAFLHTRSLIIFAFMGMSLLLTIWRKRLPLLFQRLSFAFVVLLLAIEIVAVQNSSVLTLLFETYVGRDIIATGLAIFLLMFSAWAFPDLTFFLLMLLSLTMVGLFIPVTGFLGYSALTLLDRPYVQMLLYLPLSIFGGLGLAGLNQFLQQFSFHPSPVFARAFLFSPEAIPMLAQRLLRRQSSRAAARNDEYKLNPKPLAQLATSLLFGFVILNAKVNHSFYPSDCCQIVSHDDLSAIHWMDKTLPPDANVLIASTDLFVTSLESPDTLAGVDGGVWITPLISRRTIPMRGDLNFEQSEIHTEVCKKDIGYIYVGGTSHSFNALQLDGQANWYQIAFFLPNTKVYRVDGCE